MNCCWRQHADARVSMVIIIPINEIAEKALASSIHPNLSGNSGRYLNVLNVPLRMDCRCSYKADYDFCLPRNRSEARPPALISCSGRGRRGWSAGLV